jgi:3-oxoacyl-[acyl-carrier-protein] synthase II
MRPVPFSAWSTISGPQIGSPRELLGPKGTRSMDKLTAMAVTAVGDLLADVRDEPTAGTGVVLGTSTGSAESTLSFVRESLTADRPYLVDPARFPNTVMNCAAGRSAIWYGLQGTNATVAGGRTAGLLALNYARRILGAGRCQRVICGAAEELSPDRARLEETDAVLGEGCAVLMLDQDAPDGDAPALAALRIRLAVDEKPAAALAGCVRQALADAGLQPRDVGAIACSETGGDLEGEERTAIAEVLGPDQPEQLSCADATGDTGAASAAFALVMACTRLAEHRHDDRAILVTSIDVSGLTGCALLR